MRPSRSRESSSSRVARSPSTTSTSGSPPHRPGCGSRRITRTCAASPSRAQARAPASARRPDPRTPPRPPRRRARCAAIRPRSRLRRSYRAVRGIGRAQTDEQAATAVQRDRALVARTRRFEIERPDEHFGETLASGAQDKAARARMRDLEAALRIAFRRGNRRHALKADRDRAPALAPAVRGRRGLRGRTASFSRRAPATGAPSARTLPRTSRSSLKRHAIRSGSRSGSNGPSIALAWSECDTRRWKGTCGARSGGSANATAPWFDGPRSSRTSTRASASGAPLPSSTSIASSRHGASRSSTPLEPPRACASADGR